VTLVICFSPGVRSKRIKLGKTITMARSHHRKKHKEHLKQYQHSHESISTASPKGKAFMAFTIIGAVVGLAITYFASDRSLLWSIVGVVAGGAAGYFLGKNIDKQNAK
jgi:uncharacterized membrane protein YfcA